MWPIVTRRDLVSLIGGQRSVETDIDAQARVRPRGPRLTIPPRLLVDAVLIE